MIKNAAKVQHRTMPCGKCVQNGGFVAKFGHLWRNSGFFVAKFGDLDKGQVGKLVDFVLYAYLRRSVGEGAFIVVLSCLYPSVILLRFSITHPLVFLLSPWRAKLCRLSFGLHSTLIRSRCMFGRITGEPCTRKIPA